MIFCKQSTSIIVVYIYSLMCIYSPSIIRKLCRQCESPKQSRTFIVLAILILFHKLFVLLQGSPHELLHISKLVSTLKQEIGNMKEEIIKKERELSSLHKQTSRSASQFEKETIQMVFQLQRIRNAQVRTCLLSSIFYCNKVVLSIDRVNRKIN